MKQLSKIISLLPILIVNSIPLIGVILYDWDAINILLLYWVETVVQGMFCLLKVIFATGKQKSFIPKIIVIPFFTCIFTIFMLVHAIFLTVIQKIISNEHNLIFTSISSIFTQWDVIDTGIIFLVLTQIFSFVFDYLTSGAFKKAQVKILIQDLFIKRIGIMHFYILFGWIILLISGGNIICLYLIIFFKTIIDIYSNLPSEAKSRIIIKDRIDTNNQRSTQPSTVVNIIDTILAVLIFFLLGLILYFIVIPKLQ